MIQQVGTTYIELEEPKQLHGRWYKKRTLRYSDCTSDMDGWINCEEFLPRPYDICDLKTETKILPGWYCGNTFVGLKLKPADKVLYWRKRDTDG